MRSAGPVRGWATIALLSLSLASGCARSERSDISYETPQPNNTARQSGDPYKSPKEAQDGGLLGDRLEGSIALGSLFDVFDDEEEDEALVGATGRSDIRVNGHLWAAALDTISFMPLDEADPESGIIRSGWYIDPDRPGERFRVNVFVLSGELRADGVRVSVFRQTQEPDGSWRDVPALGGSATDLERLIVERARDLSTSRA